MKIFKMIFLFTFANRNDKNNPIKPVEDVDNTIEKAIMEDFILL